MGSIFFSSGHSSGLPAKTRKKNEGRRVAWLLTVLPSMCDQVAVPLLSREGTTVRVLIHATVK